MKTEWVFGWTKALLGFYKPSCPDRDYAWSWTRLELLFFNNINIVELNTVDK